MSNSLSGSLRKIASPAAFLFGFLALWEYSINAFDVPEYIFPKPSETIQSLLLGWDAIAAQVPSTMQAIFLGFLWGTVPAIALAIPVANSKSLERSVYPLLVFIETVPKIAFAPLLLVWFGFTITPKVILTAIVVFFPVFVDTVSGLKSADPRLFYLSKSMGASRLQTFMFIQFPGALPNIFSGMKISLILTTTVIVVLEYVMGNTGVGYLILISVEQRDVQMMFAILIVVSLIGVLLNYFLEAVEYITLPWRAIVQKGQE